MLRLISTATLTAQRGLNNAGEMLARATSRVSSGSRINTAGDDAAGLAIASRMTSQIRGLAQVARNANDAIGVVQTAEDALRTVTEHTQRIRELALQAANDVNSATDRAELDREAKTLVGEIDRIASQTAYSGQSLLDGSFVGRQFQVGADGDTALTVSIRGTQASTLGLHQVTTQGGLSTSMDTPRFSSTELPTRNRFLSQTVTVSGGAGSASIAMASGSSAAQIAARINAQSTITGVTASAKTTTTLTGFTGLTSASTVSMELYGANGTAVAISAQGVRGTNLSPLVSAINAKSGETGITARLDAGSIVLENAAGHDIGLANFTTSAGGTQRFTMVGGSGQFRYVYDLSTRDSSRVGGQLTFSSSDAFTIDSNRYGSFVTAPLQSTAYTLDKLDLTTRAGANFAIESASRAIQSTSQQRTALGATQGEVTRIVDRAQTTGENTQAARSRILDTDLASEMMTVARTQIILQTGAAALAQANAMPNQVLALLR